MADAPALSARDLYDRIRGGDAVSVLDVRDRDEFEEWRIEGPNVTARQVPYVQFVTAKVSGDPASLVPDALDEPLVAVCGHGEASGETADMLVDAGVDAANLAGGMDAWADLVVAHDVPGALDVVQYERPATGCLSYLVADGDEACVVDPLRAFADRYVADAADRSLDVVAAVDTHVHADHVSGVRAVTDETGADRVLPGGATDRGLDYDATLLDDGDALDVGDTELTAVHAPGHTSELVALDANGVLFTADCLFLDGVGRPDLEDPEQAASHADSLYDTLHDTVFAYPDDTTIAPGHVQPASVEDAGPYVDPLARVRDRLTIDDLARGAFVDRVATDLPPRPANHDRIVDVNLGRASLDQHALELELGPNNCAIPG